MFAWQVVNEFMFDTVAFNRVLESSVPYDLLKPGITIYATHIQEDELTNTPNPGRRADLAKIFHQFIGRSSPTGSLVLGISESGEAKLRDAGKIPTETSLWGVFPWGEGKWGADGGLYAPIRSRLDELKRKRNNLQDALISETAIINKLCLVTDDSTLSIVTKEFGGSVLSFQEFLKVAGESLAT